MLGMKYGERQRFHGKLASSSRWRSAAKCALPVRTGGPNPLVDFWRVAGRPAKTLGREVCGGASVQTFRQGPRRRARWRLARQCEIGAGDEEAGNPAALPCRFSGTRAKDLCDHRGAPGRGKSWLGRSDPDGLFSEAVPMALRRWRKLAGKRDRLIQVRLLAAPTRCGKAHMPRLERRRA